MGKLYSFWGEGMGTLLELMVEGACRQLQRACVRGQIVFDAGEGVSSGVFCVQFACSSWDNTGRRQKGWVLGEINCTGGN
jgi:hypothetical protein